MRLFLARNKNLYIYALCSNILVTVVYAIFISVGVMQSSFGLSEFYEGVILLGGILILFLWPFFLAMLEVFVLFFIYRDDKKQKFANKRKVILSNLILAPPIMVCLNFFLFIISAVFYLFLSINMINS